MILEGIGNWLGFTNKPKTGKVSVDAARQSLIDAGQPVTTNNLRRRLAELQNDSNQEAPVVPSKAKPQVQPEAPQPISNWLTREQERIEEFNARNAVSSTNIKHGETRGTAPPILNKRSVIEKVFKGVEPTATSYVTPIYPDEDGFVVNYQRPPNGSTDSSANFGYMDFGDELVPPKNAQSPSQPPVRQQQSRPLFPVDRRPRR